MNPCFLYRTFARMDFTGKSMKGMIYFDPEGLKTAEELKTWVERALEFVLSLPAK